MRETLTVQGSRGRPSPAPEPPCRLRRPLQAGTPRNAPASGAGLMTRSVPQVLAALLLRARPFLPWAPRAFRLRQVWAKARPARRQGPAGASGFGHDAWPACGRGAHFLLAGLAGRSPVMPHCGGLRTARMRAGVAGQGPAQVAGWAARPSGHGPASRNPASARTGSSIPLRSLPHRPGRGPCARCGCGCPARAFLVAVTAHPAPSAGPVCGSSGSSGDG